MPQSPASRLMTGEVLTAGEYLSSPGRRYCAVMQADGNFVIYRGGSPARTRGVVWATNSDVGAGEYFLVLQSDGNLVIYRGSGLSSQGSYVWAAHSHDPPNCPEGVLCLGDDGSLRLYKGTAAESVNLVETMCDGVVSDSPFALDDYFQAFSSGNGSPPDVSYSMSALRGRLSNVPFSNLLVCQRPSGARTLQGQSQPSFDLIGAILQGLVGAAFMIPGVGVLAGTTATVADAYYEFQKNNEVQAAAHKCFDSSDMKGDLSEVIGEALTEGLQFDHVVQDLHTLRAEVELLRREIANIAGGLSRFESNLHLETRNLNASPPAPIGIDWSYVGGMERAELLDELHLGRVFAIMNSVEYARIMAGSQEIATSQAALPMKLASNPTPNMYVNGAVIAMVQTLVNALFLHYHICLLPEEAFDGAHDLTTFNLENALRERWHDNGTPQKPHRSAEYCLTLIRQYLDPESTDSGEVKGDWARLVDPSNGPAACAHRQIAARLEQIELRYNQPSQRDGFIFLPANVSVDWMIEYHEVGQVEPMPEFGHTTRFDDALWAAVNRRMMAECHDGQTELVDRAVLFEPDEWADFASAEGTIASTKSFFTQITMTVRRTVRNRFVPFLGLRPPKVEVYEGYGPAIRYFPCRPSSTYQYSAGYSQLCWGIGNDDAIEQSFTAWRSKVLLAYASKYNYLIDPDSAGLSTLYAISQSVRKSWLMMRNVAMDVAAKAESVVRN